VLQVEGDPPPGGFVFPWPLRTLPGSAAFDGAPIRFDETFRLPRAGRLVVQLQ
jgi:hypothetical protein